MFWVKKNDFHFFVFFFAFLKSFSVQYNLFFAKISFHAENFDDVYDDFVIC